MAATVHPPTIPSAEVVGNAFVQQYYLILHKSPDMVHRFYQDTSKLGRPEKDGHMSTTTGTLKAIDEKILALGYGEYTAEIATVDSQESHSGGVLVLVTGYLIGNENSRRKFAQSFFLAPQDKGYFVLNDVFRYVVEAKHETGEVNTAAIVEALVTPQDPPAEENHAPEQSEVVVVEEVDNPSENGDYPIEEEEVPVPEVVDELPFGSEVAAEPNSKAEEVAKKSYASIVKVMKDNGAPFSPAPTPLRPIEKHPGQVAPVASLAPSPEAHIYNPNATEYGNGQDNEVDGSSIYVKGLPLDATPVLLENEFKKFGSIRANGIQVKYQKGFCFGFVEFEEASAMQSAIEASPIMINGCRVVVEEKRSTARGNNRGRFSSGAGGGYGNDGTRGRGNFGGSKAYNRGDFGRMEFGNRGGGRGGFSNRGAGEGYRRGDRMGYNGGRGTNRGNGLPLNPADKSMTPQV